jgi:hypothetical protein
MGNEERFVRVCGLTLLCVIAALATAEAWRIRRRVPAPALRFGNDGVFKIVQVLFCSHIQ